MQIDRKYQLDENSRKHYIETKIIPYIPTALKESYIKKIPAVVDMYAGSDAEVISIIEDAVIKDNKTNQRNLEKILGILVDNSTKRRTEVLGECHKILNINHSMPKRETDVVPAVHHTKNIKDNEAMPVITKNQINHILAYYA